MVKRSIISFKANWGCRADTALPGSRGRAPRGVKGQSPLQGQSPCLHYGSTLTSKS